MIKNTRFEGFLGTRLPREVQLKRVQKMIREELTEFQREAIVGYYFQGQTISAIAQDRGVNKSTVCRTLHRAEAKIKKYLTY